MKMLNRRMFGLLAIGGLLFASCTKQADFNSSGETRIKLPQGADEKVALALDFKPGLTDVVLLDVRRDAPTNAELQKAITVKIKDDPAIVTAYNAAHATNYIALPAAAYTVDAGNPVAGGIWTVTFNAGDHARPLLIKLDPTKLDLSKQYALGFTITDAGGAKIASGLESAMVEVGVKNKYDGIYAVISGNVTRYTAPGTVENPSTLNGPLAGNPDVTMTTVGANTVEISGLQWTAGSNSGVGGINNLRATIDPVTNAVTMQALGNLTLTNWAGKDNRYDPATKTFYLAFRWNPTGAVREYQIVLQYKGPR
ncbi:MAG: DUF1735 domain-containing protein [Chitinophagaceae bacterium]